MPLSAQCAVDSALDFTIGGVVLERGTHLKATGHLKLRDTPKGDHPQKGGGRARLSGKVSVLSSVLQSRSIGKLDSCSG